MVNGSRKEIWRINKQFLDTQIAKRKTIRLSHNPNVKWEGFYDKELKYLKDNNYIIDKKSTGEVWYARPRKD